MPLAEPVAQLLGAKNFSELTETQLRLTPVIVGSATVLLFGAGVEMFGFIACLVAALLFAFAPLPRLLQPLFHPRNPVRRRHARIDSVRLARVLKTNSFWSAALAGFCAALMLACKETAVLHFFALVAGRLRRLAFRRGGKSSPPDSAAKILLAALAFSLSPAILLFTWFGQNWSALADLFRAIPNFAARAGGEGHEKPFWYYAVLLGGGWSGAVILGLAALGMLFARVRSPADRQIRSLLAIYALLIAVIYSAIPYKTPWLALNFWLPLAILAGFGVEWLWLAATKVSVRAADFGLHRSRSAFLIGHDTRQRVFANSGG